MWCAAENNNYMCHSCTKVFLDLKFNQGVIHEISNCQEIAPNLTYSQKSLFFKYRKMTEIFL